MSTPFNLSLDFLKKDTQELDQNGRDGSVGITAPKEIEDVKITQNSDGSWSQSTKKVKSSIKKDKKARSDESEKYDKEVSALTNLAKKSDDIILDVQTKINSKKQQIINIIADAVSFGCSCVVGTAVTNGVVIGIGSTVVNDKGFIKKYVGLDDPTSDVPFESINTVTISASNSGTGYESGFSINSGAEVGLYKTVYPFTGVGFPDSTCAGYASSIATLATEIDDLRSQINNSLISKTNDIKDRKTTSEVFVWGYKSREHKIKKQKNQNKSVQEIIEGETAYQ
jgi:hypothetical protein